MTIAMVNQACHRPAPPLILTLTLTLNPNPKAVTIRNPNPTDPTHPNQTHHKP